MADRRAYPGDAVTVTFDGARCLHAARCVQGLPAVFDTTRRPWIVPDGASAEAVAEVVRRCPSGALRYELHGGEPEAPAVPTRVSARPGEPVWLRGALEIDTGDGVVAERRAALCACGASANRPYCDGTGDCGGWKARVAELDG